GAGATGFFQGVGQDREVVKTAFVVDRLGDGDRRGRSPGGVPRDGVEGIPKDVPENVTLLAPMPPKSRLGIVFCRVPEDSSTRPPSSRGRTVSSHASSGVPYGRNFSSRPWSSV